MSKSRAINAAELARRQPVRVGLQFFLGMLGLVQLFERVLEVWNGQASAIPVIRLLLTAALSAGLFTWLLRRQSPPPAAA